MFFFCVADDLLDEHFIFRIYLLLGSLEYSSSNENSTALVEHSPG